ncbi:MAG: hypothetical protein JWP29_3463, partial [Rhodoferax sp.]|nr:hypothetical protein [Rhodoferax sp.]
LHGADFVPTVALTTDPHTAAAWLAGVTHG